eukprot:TRINITY_DN646_c7_g2_i1.p1 TRINITY_DN646_c7_g2~~TRINITY_DN646_c7_g2_i1.p1  ORF type:complete len:324 (+),score=41.16 TRINITY_DN646_c7_g2_i1:43-972(+)
MAEGKPKAWAPKRQHKGVMLEDNYISESMKEEEQDVCQVSNNVFISSYKGSNAVKKLQTCEVTRVLSVGCDLSPKHPTEFNYKILSVDDVLFTDLLSHAELGADFIEGNGEGGCLVHCEKGMSRSAFMVVAHSMIKRNLSLSEAYGEVKKSRPVVQPNSSFCRQLRFLESMLSSGDGPATGDLFDLFQAEFNMLDTVPYQLSDTSIPIDPATYCKKAPQGAATTSLKALFCRCSRVLASPLNFLSPDILELPSWASPERGTSVMCPDCNALVGHSTRTPDLRAIPADLLPELVLVLSNNTLVFHPIIVG